MYENFNFVCNNSRAVAGRNKRHALVIEEKEKETNP